MSHPYSGAASYIYANEHLSPPVYEDRNPYSHMRSVLPMHSLVSLPPPWPPQDEFRFRTLTGEQQMSAWGSERGMLSSDESRATWRSKAVVWRRTFTRRMRDALRNVQNMLKTRFPPWVTTPRPRLSTVQASRGFSFGLSNGPS